jgi:hypothetical protein
MAVHRGPLGAMSLELTRRIARRVPIGHFPKNYTPKVPVSGRPRLLVVGIYMAQEPNHSTHIVQELRSAHTVEVQQRWVCMMGRPPTKDVASVTVRQLDKYAPKWRLVNDLISSDDLDRFDYFMICDDDILLASRFVDHFLAEQQSLNFALAQPARTWRSITDHPIVRRRLFTRARQTNFVEIGPVVSFRRDFFKAVYPFSLESPMGWGYDLSWPITARELRVAIGIIDRIPVDHSLRQPQALYSGEQHNDLMMSYLARHAHIDWAEAARAIRIFR